MSITKRAGQALGPRLATMAPQATARVIHEAVHRAIEGVGPLPGARHAAESQLREQGEDVDKAIREVIENHVSMAGAQGFATNIGGLLTMALTTPTNVAGLALIQCRMVAAISHLRGYDLDDPRTRNAILATLLGDDRLATLIKKQRIPGPPMAIATAPVHDPSLNDLIASEVASELITRVAGKRLATVVGRRMPVVGGVVGAGTDGWSTWRIGRYAARELRKRYR